jgi:enoyl-CoA hydratase/carnithine racemase
MMKDYTLMRRNTDDFMALFRILKPVICKVHGSGAVAGGSDIALCCDFIFMSESARIGYPPAKVSSFFIILFIYLFILFFAPGLGLSHYRSVGEQSRVSGS